MRTLTFKSFLRNYIKRLSFNESLHLNKLLNEAEHHNPRIRDVLLLYMVESLDQKKLEHKLTNYSEQNKLYNKYKDSLLSHDYKTNKDNPLNKVFHSYTVKRDYQKNRSTFKNKLIHKIKQL